MRLSILTALCGALVVLAAAACAEVPPARSSTDPAGPSTRVPAVAEAASASPLRAGADAGSLECPARCSGSTTPALEGDLVLRMKMTHRCYDRALARDPSLQGRMEVAIVVGADGGVCRVQIAKDGIGDAELAACVRSFFEGARVPAPAGDCVVVKAPIAFAGMTDAGAERSAAPDAGGHTRPTPRED